MKLRGPLPLRPRQVAGPGRPESNRHAHPASKTRLPFVVAQFKSEKENCGSWRDKISAGSCHGHPPFKEKTEKLQP